jgi:hypothetical protein
MLVSGRAMCDMLSYYKQPLFVKFGVLYYEQLVLVKFGMLYYKQPLLVKFGMLFGSAAQIDRVQNISSALM